VSDERNVLLTGERMYGSTEPNSEPPDTYVSSDETRVVDGDTDNGGRPFRLPVSVRIPLEFGS